MSNTELTRRDMDEIDCYQSETKHNKARTVCMGFLPDT